MTVQTETTARATLDPLAPLNHHQPLEIAEDTWLIRQLQGEGTAPVAVYINSLVILGKEPILVDTGTPANRRRWIEDVRSLVDPTDVRWIFISHDDIDHTGNLRETLELCPNATLVSSWFQLERLTPALNLPLHRMRWVNDGEAFEAGDRRLVAIRPPIYDSPTTRGLYDAKSGVYWGSDCFATPVLRPVENAGDLHPTFWRQGFLQFQSLLSPWHTLVDPDKFCREVDRLQQLDLRVVVGAHGPAVTGRQIDTALSMLRELPAAEPAPVPGQAELEAMLAAITAAHAA